MNDFDWPPMPYTQFLTQELDEQMRYSYLNPSLDRRYDPVVVGGNAMHPVIQAGDVVLVDTGKQHPDDGEAAVVRIDGGRKLIGYWRGQDGTPVLEQERTEAVIDLSQYPNWSVYGVITKVVGRDIRPRPASPDVALRTEEAHMDVTPGQAHWIIERLLADRRISSQDVQRYVADMGREIQDIERRLASLREAAGNGPMASPAPRSEAPAAKTKKRRPGRPKKSAGHPRGIAGTLAVLLRSLPTAAHATIAAIRADKGIQAAISAARAAVKR
ncbi:MAG: Peptidase S24-like [Thermoanaerobaculia bacterium]|jgi:hypothetical protein|nr:Peptidase S24-like [Thermoanaerobaculia bacterium]